MNSELARVLERVRQNRAARGRDELTTPRNSAPLAAHDRGALVAGARAFDLVNGEHVEVVSVYRENVVVAAPERRDA